MSMPARSVAAGRGADWLAEGWRLFRAAPGPWIGVTVIWIVIALASQSSSSLMGFAFNLVTPVITGGLMLGCGAQQRGEPFRIDYLWAGFGGGRAGPLLTLGVFSLLGLLLAMLGGIAVLGVSVASTVFGGDGLEALQLGMTGLLALLIALLILIPVTMALWFAPALVVLDGLEPIAALKASFAGCLANILPLTVNGLLLIPIAIVATLPLGLGWLVAGPVIIASVYAGWRDIYAALDRGAALPGQFPT